MDKKEFFEAVTILDNEPFLRQVSKEVDLNDPELKNDIEKLENFCKNYTLCMAMAAVQLGIPKRLVYLKNTNIDVVNKIQSNTLTEEDEKYNEARVLINPVIIKREGVTEYWEACASCLEYVGHVYRPYKITVEFYDISGKKHLEIFEGFESTVLSHEMDHLDGILHMDIADEVLKMNIEERKKFRCDNNYKIFKEEGDFQELLNQMQFSYIKKLKK